MSKAQKEKGPIKKLWNKPIFSNFVFWFFLILLGFSCGMLGYQIGFDIARQTRITPIGELIPLESFSTDLLVSVGGEEGIFMTACLSLVENFDEIILHYNYGYLQFSSNVDEISYANFNASSNYVIFYKNTYLSYLKTTDFDWYYSDDMLTLDQIYFFKRVD